MAPVFGVGYSDLLPCVTPSFIAFGGEPSLREPLNGGAPAFDRRL